jgi:hypothetical protein
MTLPREGRLLRCYVQLAETGDEEESFNAKKISFDDILGKAQKIFSPFQLQSAACEWWSVYTVSAASTTGLGPTLTSAGGPPDREDHEPAQSVRCIHEPSK